MKVNRFVIILVALLLATPADLLGVEPAAAQGSAAGADKIAQEVQQTLETAAANDQVSVIVQLKEQEDVSHIKDPERRKRLQKIVNALRKRANLTQLRLRSLLRPLELIATLSPLLGLLGTVLGMIEAFRQLEVAGNQVDPAILSGGIWQALLTTAVGLVVAIPVVLAHAWLERKVERCGHLMEDAVTQVFTRNLQPLPARHEAAADPALNHAA